MYIYIYIYIYTHKYSVTLDILGYKKLRNEANSEIIIFTDQVVGIPCHLDLTVELYFVCIPLYFKRFLIISSNFMAFSFNLHYTKK